MFTITFPVHDTPGNFTFIAVTVAQDHRDETSNRMTIPTTILNPYRDRAIIEITRVHLKLHGFTRNCTGSLEIARVHLNSHGFT